MSQNSRLGEFETYLQGKTDLSQAYADLPQVELPDHLDAAILAEAHRAVSAGPTAKPKRRWPIPLGMVATLFAVVMIGLQLPYMLKEAALPQQLEERMAEPASPAPDERKEVQLMAKPKPEITRSAPMADKAEVPAMPNAPVLAAPQESKAAGAHLLGATSVAAPPSAAAPMQAPAKAAKRAELRERADTDNEVAQSKEKHASSYAEGGVSDSPEQPAGMAAPQPEQQNRSLMQPLKEAGEAALRPEDWLGRIQRLKQQGKLDQARKELAAFRKRYPDYRVPEAFEVR